MPSRILARSSAVFDQLEARWETLATQRRVATSLTFVFFSGVLVVEAERRGWLQMQRPPCPNPSDLCDTRRGLPRSSPTTRDVVREA